MSTLFWLFFLLLPISSVCPQNLIVYPHARRALETTKYTNIRQTLPTALLALAAYLSLCEPLYARSVGCSNF